MDADRLTDEPGDRQEQGREEPFADLKRLDARVKRIVADGTTIRLRNRLIQEAAKTTALGAAALGGTIVFMSAYATRGPSISRFEAAMAMSCCSAALLCGYLAALSFSKTARFWRAYRQARQSRTRAASPDEAND